MIIRDKQQYLKQYGFENIHLKAVLFDMDGVLFDSMPHHVKSWTEAVTHFSLSMTDEEVYLNEGRTGNSTIQGLARKAGREPLSEEEIRKIYSVKSDIFNRFPEASPMPYAFELLKKVRQAGLQTILVTGSGQTTLLDRLNHQFPGIFHHDTMITSFDVIHGKPNAEPYLKGLHKANIQPWEALVVENAPLGVKAATNARIFTIAVNTGPLSNSILLDEGANLLFSSIEELYRNWSQILAMLG